MEDSAKRKARLHALRSEASLAGDSGDAAAGRQDPSFLLPPPSAAIGQPLPNPMMSDPAESPSGGQRFDFYTDPMSAFSSAKRKRGGGVGVDYRSPGSVDSRPCYPVAGPNNYRGNMAHPSHQFPVGQSPDYSPYEMSNQWRTPVQYPNMSPSSNQGWNTFSGTPARAFGPNTPNSFTSPFGRTGNPMHSPGRGNYMHSPGRGNYMHSPGRGNFMHSPGRGNFMHSPGRGNSNFSSERGRGRQYWGSPSPTWSGGRGRSSSYMQHSGRQGAQSFYMKAMVKDPWRKLTPVVGNILEPKNATRSVDVRGTQSKPRSSHAEITNAPGGTPSIPKLSLAEYLAQSFEEAAEET